MNIFSGLEEIIEQNHPLDKHTWYGIGGPAQYFIRPNSVEQLQQVVKRCAENNLPIKVLGFGSNLLVDDKGVKAAVVKLEGDQFTKTEFQDDKLIAWAGTDLSKLILTCVKKGLAGLECLTGIPGSVGGAVRMNAGGQFGDIGSVVDKLLLMDLDGNTFEKSKPELAFDYRKANVTAKFILSAEVQLTKQDPEAILKTVKEIWMYKKNHQPLNTKNAGCVFKNPGSQSAGSLIEKAGLKGLTIGGASVSEKHANFIVAKKDCTSKDILKLIEMIQEKVKDQFDIELEREIEIWN